MKNAPILYIAGNGQLDAATKAYLDGYGKKPDMYIIGGTGVISAAADNNLKPYESDGAVERIFGNNRYETCLAINSEFPDYFGGENLCIATGTNFPDALAGGVLCAAKGAPLVLVDKTLDPAKNKNIADYIKSYDPDKVYIFGGTFAVSQDIEDTVAGLIK